MRISDWSSDVCSSDLVVIRFFVPEGEHVKNGEPVLRIDPGQAASQLPELDAQIEQAQATAAKTLARSEERRVGKECVSPCRSRWSPDHYKKNKKTQPYTNLKQRHNQHHKNKQI